MHVILASIGTHGDVFPYVSLGDALAARGHRVTLAVNESYRDLAHEHGFEFRSLISEADLQELLTNPDIWHPTRSAILGTRLARRCLEPQYEILKELMNRPNTILAASLPMLPGRLLQEKYQHRLVSIYHIPWAIASCVTPPVMANGWTLPRWTPRFLGALYWQVIDAVGWGLVGRHLNRFRRSLGLKPVYRLFQWWISPELAIGLFPDWYAPPQPDWPPQLKLAGFPMSDGQKDASLDNDLREFCHTGDPPIVFTFGTGMMFAKELFQAAVQACDRLSRRGILLARHPDQIPCPLPNSVRHLDYAPLTKLLPHCAAIVHHGGIGTTAKALATGTPQLVIPHAWDQFDNAQRVIRLGAGNILKRKKGTAKNLTSSLEELLTRNISGRCRELAARIDGPASMDLAARWIEEYAASPPSALPHGT